ncbi:Bifunctional solanapyrone synthase [Lecanosticta acicola]|uniref:Bifunctional solanapyrone synthase n=1 Tax=Lecanosticta acicola TaxID=111012 RepID=A0AAI9E864_9PEZI|nr:Bifunctional solanapyrone synthase [Lecanosticta acicola]
MKLVLAFLAVLAASASASDSHCCNALSAAGLGERLIAPSSSETYEAHLGKYFSTAAQLLPHCFFKPRSTEEVSKAITALVAANKTQPCQFAVRSGGHMHFKGASGIADGVTIDLADINQVVYRAEDETVAVGPGAVWGDVYSYLDKIGKMVVGGRSYSVGVGGLVLGGGNSYHAARRGLVCDNVAAFEVVLGDGSVVTATREENSDLFQALKGGSTNFGIVTRVDLEAFEGGNIFGGLILRTAGTAEEHFQALVNFGDKIHEDPYGSAIVIDVYIASMHLHVFMNAFDYTAPVKRPAVFREFFEIESPPISDTTGIRNMTDLAKELEMPKTHRVQFSTLTFKNDIRVLRKAHALFKQVIAKLEEEASGDWRAMALYQPIPTLFAEHSKGRGGNLLGLERFDENLIMYEPYMMWKGAEQDELFESQAAWLRAEVSKYAESIGADNEFLYLNYADIAQKPLESYGAENVAKIRKVAAKYDPEEVFQRMMPGGFKISKVDPEFGKLLDDTKAQSREHSEL